MAVPDLTLFALATGAVAVGGLLVVAGGARLGAVVAEWRREQHYRLVPERKLLLDID